MNLQDLVQRNGWGASRTAGAAAGERLAWIGPVRHVRAPGGSSAASGYSLRGAGTADRSSRSFAATTMLLPPGVPGRAPWHPGRFLRRNYLTPLGLSQTEAARLLGVSRRRLHEIVHGQRGITADTAIRCALVFGTDAAFWLALQSAWDSFHTWKLLRVQTRRTRGAH